MTVLTLSSLLAFIYAANQTRVAKEQKQVVIDKAEKNKILLESLQKEKGNRIWGKANEFFRYKEYDDALYEYKEALKFLPDNDTIQGRIEECKDLIQLQINEQ